MESKWCDPSTRAKCRHQQQQSIHDRSTGSPDQPDQLIKTHTCGEQTLVSDFSQGHLWRCAECSCLGHKTSGEVWGLLQARMELRNGTRTWRERTCRPSARPGHHRARSSVSSTCKGFPDKQTHNHLVSNRSYIKTLGFKAYILQPSIQIWPFNILFILHWKSYDIAW